MENTFQQSMWASYPDIKQELSTSNDFSYFTPNDLSNFDEFDDFSCAPVADMPAFSLNADMSLSSASSPHNEQTWHLHNDVASSRGSSDTESSSGTSTKTTDQRRQRRREQNRQSQRLYRARKESLLKEYAERINKLEAELETYKSDNGRLTTQLLQMNRAQQHDLKRLGAAKEIKTSYFPSLTTLASSESDYA